MTDFDRKDWLRALRTMSDDYILDLLDQAMDNAKAEAWDEGHDCCTWPTCEDNPYRNSRDATQTGEQA